MHDKEPLILHLFIQWISEKNLLNEYLERTLEWNETDFYLTEYVDIINMFPPQILIRAFDIHDQTLLINWAKISTEWRRYLGKTERYLHKNKLIRLTPIQPTRNDRHRWYSQNMWNTTTTPRPNSVIIDDGYIDNTTRIIDNTWTTNTFTDEFRTGEVGRINNYLSPIIHTEESDQYLNRILEPSILPPLTRARSATSVLNTQNRQREEHEEQRQRLFRSIFREAP